jgi:hypothetical protein
MMLSELLVTLGADIGLYTLVAGSINSDGKWLSAGAGTFSSPQQLDQLWGPEANSPENIKGFSLELISHLCGSLPWEPPTGYQMATEVTVTQIGIQATAQ